MIAFPGEPPVRRRYVGDISCTSRVIADFVPNFVAMTTGVGRGRICLASFNSPPGEPPVTVVKFSRNGPGRRSAPVSGVPPPEIAVPPPKVVVLPSGNDVPSQFGENH